MKCSYCGEKKETTIVVCEPCYHLLLNTKDAQILELEEKIRKLEGN